MYGSVMMKAFGNGKSSKQSDNDNAYTGAISVVLFSISPSRCYSNSSLFTACHVFNIGRFLATTEIRSADRYWHVYSPKREIIYRKIIVLFRKRSFMLLTQYLDA